MSIIRSLGYTSRPARLLHRNDLVHRTAADIRSKVMNLVASQIHHVATDCSSSDERRIMPVLYEAAIVDGCL